MPNLSAVWDLNVIIAFVFGLVLIFLIGRFLFWPIRLILKLVYNALIGGMMLWGVNFIGAYFGFGIAINPVTALVAGFLGIPGVILLIAVKVFFGWI